MRYLRFGCLRILLALGVLAASPLAAAPPPAPGGDRLAVRVDDAEAAAALAVLDLENAGQTVPEESWRRLFDSPGYVVLHRREAAMGVGFTDDEFKAFLRLPATRENAASWRRALEGWKRASLSEAAALAFAYLPSGARIVATVYPAIKPRKNSFVFEAASNPSIFMYLDADVTPAKFKNTVAHELHHIGLSSACPPAGAEARRAAQPPSIRQLLKWLSAYGEGVAMLAAAGGPQVHPHEVSPAEDRARWDRDVASFDQSLADQQRVFLDILSGRLADEHQIDEKMFTYFGVQGPWYTVGWRMAVTIETELGHDRLIAAACDPSTLLATYNVAAAAHNRSAQSKLALWSEALVNGLESGAREHQ